MHLILFVKSGEITSLIPFGKEKAQFIITNYKFNYELRITNYDRLRLYVRSRDVISEFLTREENKWHAFHRNIDCFPVMQMDFTGRQL
jgi:hypothetical protein